MLRLIDASGLQDMQSYADPLQPLWTDIVAYTLEAENRGGRNGSKLRLVNRRFNEEVLRVWFITQQADPPRRNELILQHDCLLARRHLQGFLLRNESIGTVSSELSTSLQAAITRLRVNVPSDRLPPNLIDGVLGDQWQFFLCAAFASLYHNHMLMANAHGQLLTSEIVDQGEEAWILIAACKLGDHDRIRSSFTEFNSKPLTAEVKHSFLLSCLCATIREGWQQAFEFFLDPELGLDLNVNGPVCCPAPIRVATEKGRVTYLKMLLHPKNRILTDGFDYERAIASAASYPDQPVRRQLVDLLTKRRGGLLTRDMRKEVVWGACRRNDQDLLSTVLERGYVDLFVSRDFLTARQFHRCALSIAAEHNSIACVKLLFGSAPSTRLWTPQALQAITTAFRRAAKSCHLEMLQLLLPHEPSLSFSEHFLCAAKVDGGIAAMEAFSGSDCQQHGGDVHAADSAWRGKISSVGGEALRLAVWSLSPSNVELLLERGVKPSDRLSARLAKTDQEVAARHVMEELLERRGYKLSPRVSTASSRLREEPAMS